MRRIRSHLTYANVMVTLLAFVVLAGGTAYAANTVFSSDIVNDQVYSADVRNDTLAGGGLAATDLQAGAVGTSEVLNDTATGGGLAAADLRSGSVGPAEAAGLGSADIANAAGGSDNVNADKLDGLDSSGLVQGRGTLLSNRVTTVPGNFRVLLAIPGLGEVGALCGNAPGEINWSNTTPSNIDVWVEDTSASVVPPDSGKFIATLDGFADSTVALGLGNDPGSRRIAIVHVFAYQSAPGAPCGFQAQGTLWTSE